MEKLSCPKDCTKSFKRILWSKDSVIINMLVNEGKKKMCFRVMNPTSTEEKNFLRRTEHFNLLDSCFQEKLSENDIAKLRVSFKMQVCDKFNFKLGVTWMFYHFLFSEFKEKTNCSINPNLLRSY